MNVQHRTYNDHRSIWMGLCFIYLTSNKIHSVDMVNLVFNAMNMKFALFEYPM